MLYRIIQFTDYLFGLYEIIVIATVIFSWLIAFNVINSYNPFVRTLWKALMAVTEPLLKPIRRFVPDLGGLDISPVILLIVIYFIRSVVLPSIAEAVGRV